MELLVFMGAILLAMAGQALFAAIVGSILVGIDNIWRMLRGKPL
jgi:hypothetical protein